MEIMIQNMFGRFDIKGYREVDSRQSGQWLFPSSSPAGKAEKLPGFTKKTSRQVELVPGSPV